MIGLLLAGSAPCVGGTPPTPSEPPRAAPPSAETASDIFGALTLLTEKPDEAHWRANLETTGLTPWRGHGGMWHLEAADGEVRAEGFFRTGETKVFLLFFPAKKVSPSEATLAWMYRTAASYSFDDSDRVELMFPEEAIADGLGHRQRSFQLSLTSGALMRTAVIMRWK